VKMLFMVSSIPFCFHPRCPSVSNDLEFGEALFFKGARGR
jgi:hypothetical protein